MRKRLRSVWRILEARFPWEKFDSPKGRTVLRRPPQDAAYTTAADFEPKETPEPPAEVPDDYPNVVPFDGASADKFRLAYARSHGFKKLGSWLLNPAHWEKASQGEPGAIDWEGVWIKGKTPAAKEVARIISVDKLRGPDVHNPAVWKKHFSHRFGGGPQ